MNIQNPLVILVLQFHTPKSREPRFDSYSGNYTPQTTTETQRSQIKKKSLKDTNATDNIKNKIIYIYF